MKRFFILGVFFSCLPVFSGYGQLSLESCQKKAIENYPQIKQYGLIEQTREYNLSNANKGYLPQLSFSAQATYQSDVTEIPIQLPNLNIKELNKDQYKIAVELNQVIWDGGAIRSQKNNLQASSDVENKKLDVEMYELNDRVNQLYFGILLIDEQLKQNILLQQELERNYRQIESYMINGIANQSDLDAVKVEQINARQRNTELQTGQDAYLRMLGAMIGVNISDSKTLEKPTATLLSSNEIKRPELQLFKAQHTLLESQKKILSASNMPKLGLFIQGAYGNPGLDMLKNEFTPYYIAGVRLSWNFGTLYTKKNEKKIIDTNIRNNQIGQETFLFNTRLQMLQENSEIKKIKELMKEDDQIISLRDNIKKAAEIKVKNGTLSVTELLREINAADQARQSKYLHEIQYLMAIYNLKNTTNN